MTEDPRVALLKDRYRRWHDCKGTDGDIWMSMVGEPFHLHSVCDGRPGAEFTATCTCREEVGRYLTGLSQDWEMDYYRIDEFVAQGDTIVAIGRTAWTNRATGKRLDTPKVDIWKFADGAAVSFSEFYDSAGMLEAAT